MIDLNKALFFDIETHRSINWKDQTPQIQKAFIDHYYDPQTYNTPEDHYSEIAGLHAEFGHVICVVFGYINSMNGEFQTMAVYDKDEKKVLEECRKIFDPFLKNGYYLAGHNIINCDVPFLVKRYIINKLKVPGILNTYGCKPWDLDYLDTMDLWKFGDYKRVSLEMICAALNINCKTDDLGGDNLYTWDIDEMDWEQLAHYCTEDVVSNYQMTKAILDYYHT